MLIGLGRRTPPISLDPIGMSGCLAHLDPLDAVSLTKTGGVAQWSVVIPNDSGLAMASVQIQALAIDQQMAPNLFGATTSNAAELLIGSW